MVSCHGIELHTPIFSLQIGLSSSCLEVLPSLGVLHCESVKSDSLT
jgi:hypothetical protein